MSKELQNYQVKFEENQEVLKSAKEFSKNKIKTKKQPKCVAVS
ncbi:hypothetical protein [Campylobacter sp. US33a]|uniref:Uncharacterized protein n=1 Tax=Campylobacter sp. CCS1377 TaxID=3158229 RepID=A0AAU7EA15_9BACT|nr:hypothetical protein [Campylobacter sp. US33a]